MARIFISHSSHNNDWAIRVRNLLKENGWDDIFLDLDPVRGIAAGEQWKGRSPLRGRAGTRLASLARIAMVQGGNGSQLL